MSQPEFDERKYYQPPTGLRKYLRFAPYYVRLRRWVSFIDPFARRHRVVGRADLVRMKRKFQFNFLRGQGLAPHHAFLDIGCGSLLGGLPVIRYLEPGHYAGLDVRAEVLEIAQAEVRRYKLEAKAPTLVQIQDLRQLELGKKFDFIFSFSVLFHLHDEQVQEGFKFAQRHLAPQGVYLANVSTFGFPVRKWFEFPIIDRPLESYKKWAEEAGLSLEVIGTLGSFGHRSYFWSEDDQPMLRFRLK